jgi:hypothetical protein
MRLLCFADGVLHLTLCIVVAFNLFIALATRNQKATAS